MALAFLSAQTAWEEYLEAVFVRYLAGAASESGYEAPPRVGYATSLQHALALLAGDPNYRRGVDYLEWSQPGETIERARLFFEEGEPFSSALGHWRQRLRDASRIRNRVAHRSERARRQFKEVALRFLGMNEDEKLRQGYGVGDLLAEPAVRGFPGIGAPDVWYVDAYLAMYEDLDGRLCP